MSGFKEKIRISLLKGAFWQGIQTFFQDGVIFLLGILLARLLSPREFGVYAIILFFVSLLEVFSEGGLGVALVQKKRIDHDDCSTVLCFNMFVGSLCVALLWVGAPWIGSFYEMPEVTWLIRILSLKILIDNIRLVSFARLRRKLRFRELAYARIGATACGGVTGVAMALYQFGTWSFIGQQLVSAVVMTALCVFWQPWKMQISFKMKNLKMLLSFGGSLLIINAMNRLMNNVYTLIIGKVYSADSLGFYNRAQALQGIPVKIGQVIIGESGGTVLYRLQGDDKTLRDYLFKLLQTTVFIFFPILFGAAAAANSIIVVLLGERWLPSAEYLPILCLIGIFLEINYFSHILYKVKGQVRILFNSECICRICMVAGAVLICWQHGSIDWLLWSGVLAHCVGYWYDCLKCEKMLNFGFLMRLKLLWKCLLCNILMYVIVSALGYIFNSRLPVIVLLVLQVASGGISYLLFCYLLQVPGCRDGMNMLLQKLKVK